MSLSEVQGIYETLAKIDELLAHIQANKEKIVADTPQVVSLQKQISQLNSMILMIGTYSNSKTLNEAIQRFMQLYRIVASVNILVATGKLAMSEGLDVGAWVSLGTNIGALGLNVASMTQSGGV